MKDHSHVRLAARRRDVHEVEDLLQMRRLAGRLEVASHRFVERRQADGVLLLERHVCQRRRDELGVLELRHVLARGVGHRLARIQQQVQEKVRLLLVLLEVELVGLGPDLPVDVADVVAGHVLAVLGELDREAVVRAGCIPAT